MSESGGALGQTPAETRKTEGTEPRFEFRATDDPAAVQIVKTDTGEVVGNALLYDDSSEFSPGVWRWKVSLTTGNSGGGYLWMG